MPDSHSCMVMPNSESISIQKHKNWAVTWEVWALPVHQLSWVIPALPSQIPGWCDHGTNWFLLGAFYKVGSSWESSDALVIMYEKSRQCTSYLILQLLDPWVSFVGIIWTWQMAAVWGQGMVVWVSCVCVCFLLLFSNHFCQGFNLKKKTNLGVPCEAFLTLESFQTSCLWTFEPYLLRMPFCLFGLVWFLFLFGWFWFLGFY